MKRKILILVRSPRVLILVAPLVLMSPVWLIGRAMYWGTPSTQFIPWWWQAWQTLLAGELPLWNPMLGMGAPLLANYQSALLYPPTWIYFLLAAIGGLPLMAWGQAILVALHLAWAGWGMGLLIRRLGRSELAQTVGGLAFGLSGYLVARAHFLSINATVAWLPWILLAAYDLVQEPRNKSAIFKLALGLAFQWLAGHAQLAWYTLLLAVAWTAFWAIRAGGWRSLGGSALRFSSAGAIAFALTAIQLMPTAEYLANSQRAAQVGFAQAANYSFWPWRLIGLAAPNFFGNPAQGDYWGYGNFWEDAIYIGLLPFLLAVAALWWIRKNTEHKTLKLFLLTITLVSFVLALGNNTPLFEWLYHNVPSFALFQSPSRFTIWLVVAIALLAALAIDEWKPPIGRALYWSRLSLAAGVAVILGAGIGRFLAERGAFEAPDTFFNATLAFGLVALAANWLHLRAPSSEANPTWAWLVSGLVAADLLFAGWGLNPGANLELYRVDAGFHAGLRQGLGDGRLFISELDEYELRYNTAFQFGNFFAEDPIDIRTNLLPNISLFYRIQSANNYDPLVPARYRQLLDELSETNVSESWLARMNVSVLEKTGQGSIGFVRVMPLPRVRWVNCAYDVTNVEEAFSLLTETGFDATMVVIEGIDDQGFCESLSSGSVEIIRETANSIDVSVNAPEGGWLILADMVYPGWQAITDREELTIYPADGIYRAVELMPGHQKIKFVYRPMWFYTGAALSLVAWPGMYLFWKRLHDE